MATLGEAVRQAHDLLSAGRFAEAEVLYRQLLAAVPAEPALWHEMGLLQLHLGRADSAVEFLERSVALEPGASAYHSNLGTAYRALGRKDDAVAAFSRALECGPRSADLCNNLALAFKDARRHEDALVLFDEAVRLRPEYANAQFNRGNLLLDVGRLDEAVDAYRAALVLDPDDAGAHCKLGVAFYDLGRMDESLASFNAALALQPDYPEVRRNRALVRLVRGEYPAGWAEFEYRTECDGFPKHSFPQPRWNGAPLDGRTLFVCAEQGLGDTLQFVRYVPLVEEAGGRVRLEAQAALHPLLIRSGFGPWLIPDGAVEPFDVHCPLMSLAGYLPDRTGRPLWERDYLEADASLVAKWRTRLSGAARQRIGIVWAGNPDHPHDQFRSVRLIEFAPLARIPGVELVSLQLGSPRAQIAQVAATLRVIDLGEDLDAAGGAFMDTAAVIRNLDLVVTVDTSIAHLAGGLGAKVWVALHASPDWRWLTSGRETTWYPSMRLFRQQKLGSWASVFAEMAAELERFASAQAG